MKKVAEHIHGYTYGTSTVASSAVSLTQLDDLKISAGFTARDQRYLQLAGSVLEDQTRQIVAHWRSGIIAGIPNLARHSRTPEGEPNPDYLAKSNLRFEQWILDTCLRPYDQDWLDYQQEIALSPFMKGGLSTILRLARRRNTVHLYKVSYSRKMTNRTTIWRSELPTLRPDSQSSPRQPLPWVQG